MGGETTRRASSRVRPSATPHRCGATARGAKKDPQCEPTVPPPHRMSRVERGVTDRDRPQPDGKVRLAFKDFVQPKDTMTIDVDAKAALLSALSVATYLEKPEDTVTLDVRFATLADGTSYTSQTTLEAKAKNIRVVIQNSGHRPLAP